MLIIIPKKEADIIHKVEQQLQGNLMDIAREYGIQWEFITDSKNIKEGIEKIAQAMTRICTKVKPDKQVIDDIKTQKVFQKRLDKIEKKETLKNEPKKHPKNI